MPPRRNMGALFSFAINSLPFKENPFFLQILLPLYTFWLQTQSVCKLRRNAL